MSKGLAGRWSSWSRPGEAPGDVPILEWIKLSEDGVGTKPAHEWEMWIDESSAAFELAVLDSTGFEAMLALFVSFDSLMS